MSQFFNDATSIKRRNPFADSSIQQQSHHMNQGYAQATSGNNNVNTKTVNANNLSPYGMCLCC